MVDLQPVFDAIRPLYAKHAPLCVVLNDAPGRYALNTHEVRARDGYVTAFGSVEIKKNYVSAHVFALYLYPDMVAPLSDALRRRMQGKSCFNFRTVDAPLLIELGALIDAGTARLKADGKL